MNFDNYQAECRLTAIYPQERGVEYTALGLASEAGEVAGKVKKQLRDGHTWSGEQREEVRQLIGKEIGDVLWYAAELCSQYGLSLGDVAQGNLDKLRSRAQRNQLRGDGDSR